MDASGVYILLVLVPGPASGSIQRLAQLLLYQLPTETNKIHQHEELV